MTIVILMSGNVTFVSSLVVSVVMDHRNTYAWWRDVCFLERGTWRIGRAPGCLASHACVPGSSPADIAQGFQRNIFVY